ncbi:tRNA uridine(34) 5-carboxymethylaminomethyl modification radical SAM/GNAT enzyme Elp3 [Candidatus Micrarchaeota archaeon]|nr:tRNA uridine(34) 5-carboxymethylaminomethyl modification radical SAM/GNAT enzyme Elp3 [Candidatus Micrarchaeota archaeon]
MIEQILNGRTDIDKIKRELSRKYDLGSIIKNPEILARFPKDKLTPQIKKLIIKKPTKTLSGVTPIAVMIRPQDSCKWGCVYCPFTGLAAKSYTGFEPAALRSRQFNYDSYLQASGRVKQFEGGGHPTDKCEVIVMGGTFLETSQQYKTEFIKGIYDALNGNAKDEAKTLEESRELNEKAKHRVIGLTIETRPDVCIPYIDEMLSYGATRVEMGVQNPDDEVYAKTNRGHKVKDVIDSTLALKNAAFKIVYHLMPGLPGSSPQKDIAMLRKVFENPDFRPDMLKIYPTLVVGGTVLSKWQKEGKYQPYSAEEAAEVISEFYRYIPRYVRVMRIQRDIPAQKIEEGVKKSNLRELVEDKIREKKIEPQEIRYREVGLSKLKFKNSDFEMKRFDYDASGGKEIFLSFENESGLIAGFIRLRIPGKTKSVRSEIDSSSALIRELHIYGSEVPVSERGSDASQHVGFGTKLLNEAERIAKEEFGETKMIIISGVGVREYYRKQGYERLGPYMARKL